MTTCFHTSRSPSSNAEMVFNDIDTSLISSEYDHLYKKRTPVSSVAIRWENIIAIVNILFACTGCQRKKFIASDTTSMTSYCPTCQTSGWFKGQTQPRMTTYPPPSQTTFQPCPYFATCLEFLLTLDIPKRLFNRKHNRCFCERCYSTSKPDFFTQGRWKCVIPRGWVRFGLYIDEAQAKVEDIWEKWIVTYHGTFPAVAKSIIQHHQFLLPGDHSIDGDRISIREGHIPGKNHIYTSPAIAYSANEIYAHPKQYRSRYGRLCRAKTVLQCRQDPSTLKIQGETIGAREKRLCPIIPNSEIEYFTEVRASIIPFGLLIRVE